MIETPAVMALARAYYETFHFQPGALPFVELNSVAVWDAVRRSKKLKLLPALAKSYLKQYQEQEKQEIVNEEELEIDRYINRWYDSAKKKPGDKVPTRDAARKAIRELIAKEKK